MGVMLVSFFSGTVRSTPGYDKMRQMRSFVALQTGVTVGSQVELTVDLFTAVGVLVLAHTDGLQLQADLAEVRRMEAEGLFTFEDSVERMDAASPVGHCYTSRSAELEKESAGKNSEGYHGNSCPRCLACRSIEELASFIEAGNLQAASFSPASCACGRECPTG